MDLTAMQTAMMEYGKALLLWNLGQEEADASFQSLIDKMENRGIQPIQKAAIYQSYGTVLCRSGRNTEGFSYLEKSLDEITNVWHPYVKYLNDTRLIMILAPVQMTFHSCYARGRQFADSAVLYEWILRFKALASLAGRERNRMLQKIRFSRSFWNGSGKHRMQLQHWSRKICFGMQKRIMRNSWKICETWK